MTCVRLFLPWGKFIQLHVLVSAAPEAAWSLCAWLLSPVRVMFWSFLIGKISPSSSLSLSLTRTHWLLLLNWLCWNLTKASPDVHGYVFSLRVRTLLPFFSTSTCLRKHDSGGTFAVFTVSYGLNASSVSYLKNVGLCVLIYDQVRYSGTALLSASMFLFPSHHFYRAALFSYYFGLVALDYPNVIDRISNVLGSNTLLMLYCLLTVNKVWILEKVT